MCDVSVKTLHHYDELGILEPDRVDGFTGYRYYSASQMGRLNQILAFKEAGFSLSEIAEVFSNKPPAEALVLMLEEKAEQLEQALKLEQQRIGRLRTNIFLIKNGGIPLMNEITIKKTQPILAASLRATIHSIDELGPLWEELNAYIDSRGGRRTIPCMMLYHSAFHLETGADIEVVEPITKAFPGNDRISVYELPAEEKIACIVHNGPFSTIPSTYAAIEKWVDENGYSLKGPVREIYHKGDWATDDPDEYVTEIQYPLK